VALFAIALLATNEFANAAPAHAPISLRSDLKIRKIGAVGDGMMRLDIDPATKILTYLDAQGNVFEFDKASGRGKLAYSHREIGGGDYVMGMAFGPDRVLYIFGNETQGSRNRCIVRRVVREGPARQWVTLVQTEWYPKSNTQYDHNCNAIAVSPDNKWVYVNIGSRTDHGEVQDVKGQYLNLREAPLTSAVFRVSTTARDVVLPNDEAKLKAGGYLFADGVRNAFDFAFTATGDLMAVENGPDMTLPDEINWLREGRHYGFPWRFGNTDNPQQFAGFDPGKDGRLTDDFVAVKQGMYANDPTFPKAPMAFTDPITNTGPDADQYVDANGKVVDASDQKQTLAGVTAHRSPLGLVFDTANALGGDYTGAGFVASWGAAGGQQTDKGQDLLMLKLTKKGDAYTMSATQIAKGFANPMDAVLDGKLLYVLDFSNGGTIWEIAFP
jgi:glucose/arabinose dehydrogenase